jgi:hypothetical protein
MSLPYRAIFKRIAAASEHLASPFGRMPCWSYSSEGPLSLSQTLSTATPSEREPVDARKKIRRETNRVLLFQAFRASIQNNNQFECMATAAIDGFQVFIVELKSNQRSPLGTTASTLTETC